MAAYEWLSEDHDVVVHMYIGAGTELAYRRVEARRAHGQ